MAFEKLDLHSDLKVFSPTEVYPAVMLLNQTVCKFDGFFIGGIAVMAHTSCERQLGDIDILVPLKREAEFVQALTQIVPRNAVEVLEMGGTNFKLPTLGEGSIDVEIWWQKRIPQGIKVSSLLGSTYKLQSQISTLKEFSGLVIPVASLELIKAMKGKSKRKKDILDLGELEKIEA